MNHRVHKKMYKIHGFCFDCTINYEAELRKAGLFEKYEKSMIQGNMRAFSKDLSEWVDMYVQSTQTFVTEQGVIEDWKGNDKAQNDKVLNNLKEYLAIIDDHLD